MRLPTNLKRIAVFGSCASGKTSVARALAVHLGCEVRHCGEMVRERAAALEVTPVDLPDVEHQRIDEDTRLRTATADGYLVVEGTFLDAVLSATPGVLLVELVCDEAVRRSRFATRQSSGTVTERDVTDGRIRHRLYGSEAREADVVLDRTKLTVDQTVGAIVDILRAES